MAKDLSQYSDEELARAAGVGLSDASDEELAAIAGVELEPQSALQKVAGGLATAGEFIDRFTGAPSRAGVVRGIEEKSIPAGAKAFVEQFGEPTATAPTEEQTRKAIGVPEFPGSDFLTGMAVDWTNIVPGIGLAKKGGRAALEGAGLLKPSILPKAVGDLKRSEKLASSAEKLAITQGGGKAKQWRSLIAKGKDKEFGRFLIDSGLVKIGDDVEDVAEKATSLQSAAGQRIEDIVERLTETGILAPDVQISDSLNSAIRKQFSGKKLSGPVEERLARLIKRTETGPYSPREIIELRREIDDMLKPSTWNKPKSAWTSYEKGLGNIRNALNDEVDKLAKSLKDSSLAQQLKDANKQYSLSTAAKEMAQSRLSQTSGNMRIGALDYMTGVGGATAGMMRGNIEEAALLGLLGTLGSAGIRKYGAGAAMRAADLLSKGSKYSGYDYLEPMLPYLRRTLQTPSAQARLRALEQEE